MGTCGLCHGTGEIDAGNDPRMITCVCDGTGRLSSYQAQTSLEAERDAYWARRALDAIGFTAAQSEPVPTRGLSKLGRKFRRRRGEETGAGQPGQLVPNRADRRAHGVGVKGASRSQRHRPARPTFAQLRAQRDR